MAKSDLNKSPITPTEAAIPVIAYEFDTMKEVGRFESMAKAARKLFIRGHNKIHGYIFGTTGRTFTKKSRGVGNYKDNTRYHFELDKTKMQPAKSSISCDSLRSNIV